MLGSVRLTDQVMDNAQCKIYEMAPLVIKWCIYLRHLSGSAYELLCNTGCLKLPSQRTLRDYTYLTFGYSSEIDAQLMKAQYVRCIGLIIDEVYIKEDLVLDKSTEELIGFRNLGETKNQLLHCDESRLDSDEQRDELAKTMFVIMVRGLLSKLCFPYAQFAATTLNGDMIFDPIWEAVSRLEQCGFKMLTITADGTSSHRSLFKIHGVSGSSRYRTLNPHSAEERYINFISDPPHLIKTVRNCFSKQLLWVSHCTNMCMHVKPFYFNLSALVKASSGSMW